MISIDGCQIWWPIPYEFQRRFYGSVAADPFICKAADTHSSQATVDNVTFVDLDLDFMAARLIKYVCSLYLWTLNNKV